MEKLGQANNRQVYYLSVVNRANWAGLLPSDTWLAIPIADNKDKRLIGEIAHACLENKVTYICSLGKECEWVHDWFDEAILLRRIKLGLPISLPDDFEYEPMTTWHNNFNQGFWFALTSAYDDYIEIDKVVCLDLTKTGYKEQLTNLLSKINKGWLPSVDTN